MQFIYACDIHGDRNKYEKLLEILKKRKINNLVLGGDLFSKNAEDRIPIQKKFIEEYLNEYFKRLEEEKINYIGIVGNDDLVIPSKDYYELVKKYPNIHDVNMKKYDFQDISFIGLNYVLDAPFKRKDNIALEKGLKMPEQWSDVIYVDNCQRVITKEEWKEERKKCPMMEDLLNNLPKPSKGNKAIYIFHDPPYNVGLDKCRDGTIAGSKAILNFIKNNKPYMTLHGHIHESPANTGIWSTKIGDTISIQPGQTELGEKKLHYVIIDTDNNTYERVIVEC